VSSEEIRVDSSTIQGSPISNLLIDHINVRIVKIFSTLGFSSKRLKPLSSLSPPAFHTTIQRTKGSAISSSLKWSKWALLADCYPVRASFLPVSKQEFEGGKERKSILSSSACELVLSAFFHRQLKACPSHWHVRLSREWAASYFQKNEKITWYWMRRISRTMSMNSRISKYYPSQNDNNSGTRYGRNSEERGRHYFEYNLVFYP